VPHALDAELGLFYVGISPKRPSSKQNIHERVRLHMAGNTGSSAFRYVLAALLLDELKLVPFARGDRVMLDRHGNAHLSNGSARSSVSAGVSVRDHGRSRTT
jgi:hypothetical protein